MYSNKGMNELSEWNTLLDGDHLFWIWIEPNDDLQTSRIESIGPNHLHVLRIHPFVFLKNAPRISEFIMILSWLWNPFVCRRQEYFAKKRCQLNSVFRFHWLPDAYMIRCTSMTNRVIRNRTLFLTSKICRWNNWTRGATLILILFAFLAAVIDGVNNLIWDRVHRRLCWIGGRPRFQNGGIRSSNCYNKCCSFGMAGQKEEKKARTSIMQSTDPISPLVFSCR